MFNTVALLCGTLYNAIFFATLQPIIIGGNNNY